jgi:peptidoglycan/xylan/chitin deacetylase (PgdA/CDA1 family)
MDEGANATRTPPGPRPPEGKRAAGPGRISYAPLYVYRRRRAAAVMAALALLVAGFVVAVLAAGGGTAARHRPPPAQAPLFGEIRTLAGSGAGSLVAEYEQAETDAIDRTLSYTPYVRIAGDQHREVALTFDDGPGPYTPEVLDVLERERAPGTFFQVGVLQRYFHDATARIVDDGFPIGDHTWSHAPMSQLPRSEQQTQLLKEIASIRRYGAPFPRLFRPPYGDFNPTTLALLKRYRMLMVLWTVDTDDYMLPGVHAIVRAALEGARPGAIILLHDAGGDRSETVAALPIIIRDLRIRGYRLVTVPRLLLDNPPPRVQNIAAVLGKGGS